MGSGPSFLLVLLLGLVPLLWVPGCADPFTTPREAWVLALIAPVAAYFWWRNDAARRAARAPLGCLLLALLAGALPHLVGTFDPYALAKYLRLVAMPAVFVIAGAVVGVDARGRRNLVVGVALGALPVLAVGLLRRHAGWPAALPDRPDVALSATIGNSNELAEAFAPILLAAVAMLATARRRAQVVALAVGAAAAAALVLLSQSRGGWLAVAVAGLVGAAAWVAGGFRGDPATRRPGGWVRIALVLGVLGMASGAVTFVPAAQGVRERLRSIVSAEHPTNVVRLSTWRSTLPVIAGSFPLGVGGGRFEEAFLPHRDTAEWRLSGIDTRVDSPHQEFLWMGAEGGLLGMVALALLIVLGCRRVLQPAVDRGPAAVSTDDPPARLALLLAGLAFGVVACVRSPLHHASGTVAAAALLGALGPRVGRGRLPRAIDAIALAVLVLACLVALLNLREDRLLGSAIESLNLGKAAVHEHQADLATSSLLDAGRRIRDVRHAVLKDFSRSFRAALAAGELTQTRTGLAAAKLPRESYAELPDVEDTRALLDETLRLFPHHPGATNQLAFLWLQQGSVAEAVATLKSAIDALPNAPRFRRNLAVIFAAAEQHADAYEWMTRELALPGGAAIEDQILLWSHALALGGDPPQFGRYLGGDPPPQATDEILDQVRELHEHGHSNEARVLMLRHLFEVPGDARVLARLAEVDYAIGAKQTEPAVLSEANQAFARSRVRFALQSEAAGDHEQAELFLKLALQKDQNLLDGIYLRARIAVRLAHMPQAIEALQKLLDRGIKKDDLRSLVTSDPVLNPWYAAGQFRDIGI